MQSSHTQSADRAVDVAIVGAGLVGRPLAAALSRQGLSVVLIDRGADGDESLPTVDSLDQRCTALSAGSVDWLHAQGLWQPQPAAASPIQQVHVSQRGFFGATRLHASELDRQALGWTIENRLLGAALDACLADTSVSRMAPREVQSIEQHDTGVSVELGVPEQNTTAESVQAKLLVIADGVRSTTAQLLGITTTETPHKQWATLTTIETDRDHKDIARERFTESGPLALLPRPGRRLSVVACHSDAEYADIQALDDAGFVTWLDARLPARSGRVMQVGPRVCIPLARVEASTQHLGRCVLLGNAARLLHPVAGQGYNLALRDVASLATAVTATSDPGDEHVLRDWVASRTDDQRSTVQLTDGLARLFKGRSRMLGHARASGLLALDLLPVLRRGFARSTTKGPLF